jgi:hypothetical protein
MTEAGDALRKFWRGLRLSQVRVEAVSMGTSLAYWAAVLENLPEATIVFDRFHLAKLVNEKLMTCAGSRPPHQQGHSLIHPAGRLAAGNRPPAGRRVDNAGQPTTHQTSEFSHPMGREQRCSREHVLITHNQRES